MFKNILIFLGVVIISAFFVFQADSADCVLQSASWNKSRAEVGEIVNITIKGQNCAGWGVAIKIWEEDIGPDGLTGFKVTLNFTGNSDTLTTIWVAENSYDLTGDNKFYIEANAGSQTVYSYSGGATNPYLYVKTGAPTSGPGTPGGGSPGETKTYSFSIPNPLKGGASDFSSLVQVIAQWIFNLAIPIAVVMIVYAGVLFLTAQGDTGKVTKAKDVLKWAVVGLAIILIGSGFVTLIQSVLELGSDNTTVPGNSLPIDGSQPTGAIGSKCSSDRNCLSALKCKNSICQRPTGNLEGEPCNGGASCAAGLACDATGESKKVIDGQTLGLCFKPSPSE